MGAKLACLLIRLGSGMSGRPTACMVRSVNAWCLRSIIVVAYQERYHGTATGQNRYRDLLCGLHIHELWTDTVGNFAFFAVRVHL